jgi:hypothetical protein
VEVTVELENGFLRYTFRGDWDWDVFNRAVERGCALRHEQPINVLLDLINAQHVSTDAVLHLKRAVRLAEQNSGHYVVVATSANALTIFMLFTRIYNSLANRFHLVESLEEAYALLQTQDFASSTHPETA